MSTIRTVNIQHPSSSTPSITMDSTGAMTGSFPYPNRNLIYNGAMQIHQRSASVAEITTSNYYTADRWRTAVSSLGTWTQSVENDAPTGSGFSRSLKMLCTTANASPAAGDVLQVTQRLEGQDLQRIAKGTSSAQQLTLSFWIKSNVTGTYIVRLLDNDNSNRFCNSSYTINTSATWERKVITFPADTANFPLDNDNAASLVITWWLAGGSNYTSGSIQPSWSPYVAANEAPGQTNLASAINNYWQITGVQLETGSIATPFEFKSFGQELRECQRYYYRWSSALSGDNYGRFPYALATSTTAVDWIFQHPVRMRTRPTAIDSSALTINGVATNSVTIGSPSTDDIAAIVATTATSHGIAAWAMARIYANNSLSAYFALGAEL